MLSHGVDPVDSYTTLTLPGGVVWRQGALAMRRVVAACFWVCLACAVAGATVGVLLVWGLATD